MAPHRSDAPQQACRPTSPLSAPITATEALTFTGDATKGFFRPVTLVEDQKLLMTYMPGAVTATKMVGQGVFTSAMSVKRTVSTSNLTPSSTSNLASATISSAATSEGPPSKVQAKKSDSVVVVDSAIITSSATLSSLSSTSSLGSSTSASLPTSTTSRAWIGRNEMSSKGLAILVAVLALGGSLL
ncbi:uncharacterized protein RCO7_09687 [Rhynchosporium graminicola]|uniref:Uncharacterized protein n=1 Tax=Rhynchosporium graminicola TaxID=2792576 RepID=A0A1E1L9S6_9HELO|nr:uncharacterized protein RCO7_09687 [Rhynchosporium commune]